MLFMALLLALQLVNYAGLMPQAQAAPLAGDIIDTVLVYEGQEPDADTLLGCLEDVQCPSVIASVYLASGSPTPETYARDVSDAIKGNEAISLIYRWSLSDEDASAGGTLAFDLPAAFEIEDDIEDAVILGQSGPIGSFDVDASAKRLEAVFDPQSAPLSKSGILAVNAWLEKTLVVENNQIELTIPMNGQNVIVDVPVRLEGTGPDVEKRSTGVDRAVNTTEITWEIDINKGLKSLEQPVVEDKLPPELELKAGSVAIYPLEVNLNGDFTELATPLDPGKYDPVAGSSGFTVTFDDPIHSAYRIKFATVVKPDADINEAGMPLSNKAELYDGGDKIGEGEDSETVRRGAMLRKETVGEVEQTADHTAAWRILFNFGELELTDPVLEDMLPVGHKVEGDLTVYTVEVTDSGGVGSKIADIDPSAYTYNYQAAAESSAPDSFTLKLDGAIDKAYVIEYKTKSKDDAPVTGDGSITNTVSYESWEDEATATIVQQLIHKSVGTVNYEARKVSWQIRLNENSYRLAGSDDGSSPLRIVDSFGKLGLELDLASVEVVDEGDPDDPGDSKTLVPGDDYTVAPTASGGKESGFVLAFADGYEMAAPHVIRYTTTFDYDLYVDGIDSWDADSYDDFPNAGTLHWHRILSAGGTELDDGGSQSAGATFTPNAQMRNNGEKKGTWNPVAKEVQWEVLFNYPGEAVEDAVLTDRLEAGQTLKGSVQVRVYEGVNANGSLKPSDVVDPDDYEVIYPAGAPGDDPTLEIHFKDTLEPSPYLLAYTTSLDDALIPKVIRNTARMTSGNGYHAELGQSVTNRYGDEFLFKEMTQTQRLASWTLWINRSLSTIDDVVIEDRPDRYQTLIPSTFKLYEAVLHPDGRIDLPSDPADWDEVDSTEYEIRFFTDPDTGLEMFTLSFENEVNSPYVLKYDAILSPDTGSRVENKVSIGAQQTISDNSQVNSDVAISRSSGFGLAFPGAGDYTGSLKVVKTDAEDGGKKLPGARFTLEYVGSDAPGMPSRSGTTGANGEVVFDELEFGQYILRETEPPAGYRLDTAEETIIVNSNGEQEIVVQNTSVQGEIGDYVWLDSNRNGIQDEPAGSGLNGITVRLFEKDGSGNFVQVGADTITDDHPVTHEPGYYLFKELPSGDYYVQFDLPDVYELTTQEADSDDPAYQPSDEHDSNATDGNLLTDVIPIGWTAPRGWQDHTIDLGVVRKGVVGDYVWLDWDGDGKQGTDARERGVGGIKVNLYDATAPSVELATTTTDGDGNYRFDNLPAGDYLVEFEVPRSYGLTKADPSVGSADDSNAAVENGSLADGATKYILNTPVAIGGPASWEDLTIDLGLVAKGKIGDYVWFDRNNDGLQDSDDFGVPGIRVELYKDEAGTLVLVDQQVTDADGGYLFEQLLEGSYYVKFETPDIYDLAKFEQGADRGLDSNRIETTGPDRGLTVASIPIGPSGWEDLTIDLGFVGYGAIGNYVWYDRNSDGVQNEQPEDGINGVTVNLYEEQPGGGKRLLKSTVTGNDSGGNPGYYRFGDLPAGKYYVRFDIPPAYKVTAAEQGGNEGSDSNWTDETGTTRVIEIGEHAKYGWVDPTIDLGLVPRGKIGDYVWYDRNNNGIQDAGDYGIPDIRVELYKDDAGALVLVDEQATDANGRYLFEHLLEGSYYVKFETPVIYGLASFEQGADRGLDSNRIETAGTDRGLTAAPIPIGPGGWEDLTIDLGFVGLGAIGDYVWYDRNSDGIQNEGPEDGINGIEVHLYIEQPGGDKQLVKSTVTGNDAKGNPGYYQFGELMAGKYYVRFDIPAVYKTTAAEQGGNDGGDSNWTDEAGMTRVVEIGDDAKYGWVDPTIDLGLVPRGKIGDYVWYDRNNNGIQDDRDFGIPGIRVELYKDDAGTLVLVDEQATDANGRYLFEHLLEGSYYVKFETPDIYDLAKFEQGDDRSLDSNRIVTTNGRRRERQSGLLPL